MVAELLRRLGKQRSAVHVCQRWQRKFPRAFPLERITSLDECAVQVAGFARSAADMLEAVEKRFQLLIADAEILDCHAIGYEILAVALGDVALKAQLLRQHAPVLAIPVHPPATDAGSRQKRAQLPIGQGMVAA